MTLSIKDQLEQYITAHTDEMLEDIFTLCRIDSVRGEAKPGMPYGEGPHRALMAAKELCASYDFQVQEYADRVISADLNDGARCLDILAHMDVVAAGDGWTKTEPFEPARIGDAICGRGTSDDKGPAVAALYAMRAVKELGIPLTKNCRLILGSDEECGSSDIPYYYAAEPEAPMTFSPDAEFPLINIEKGQFRGELKAAFEDAVQIAEDPSADEEKPGIRTLCSFVSGDTTNIVPGKADAEVKGFSEEEIRAAVNALFNEISADYELTYAYGENGAAAIHVDGRTAHASTPEQGVNAGVILLQLLKRLSFTDAAFDRQLKALAELFPYGDHHGAALHAEVCDDKSGYSSFSPDIFRGDAASLYVKFDARTSILATEENTILKVQEAAANAGFAFHHAFNPPHAVPEDTPFIRTLLDAFEEVTGKPGRCVAIGGGTYVHDLKNGVAFGAVGETTDTHMHGPDEWMPVKELQEAAVIYALAIARICA